MLCGQMLPQNGMLAGEQFTRWLEVYFNWLTGNEVFFSKSVLQMWVMKKMLNEAGSNQRKLKVHSHYDVLKSLYQDMTFFFIKSIIKVRHFKDLLALASIP